MIFSGCQPSRDGDGDVQLPAFRQGQKCELLNGPNTLLHLVSYAPRGAGRRHKTADSAPCSEETCGLCRAVSALSFLPCGSAPLLASTRNPLRQTLPPPPRLHVREGETGCEAEQETAAGPKGGSLPPDLAGLAPGSLISVAGKTASQIAQWVKNLPAMQETQIRFLGGEDPLEKG